MSNIKHRAFNSDFGIWFDGKSNLFNYDIHINEWINSTSNFIDIGIRIYNTDKISNGYIYIPFTLPPEAQIKDLSKYFEDEKICRGIFNSSCTTQTRYEYSIIEIKYNNRIEDVIPLELLSPTINSHYNGTLLHLFFKKVIHKLHNYETYIRFRIPYVPLNECFTLHKYDYNIIFESPIIKEKINHTIKINEQRSLPDSIRLSINNTLQHINKVIITVSAPQEYLIDDSSCYKVRNLEKDLYSEYVPLNFKCENAITYQWLQENKGNKKYFNFHVKIETQELSKVSLFIYAIMAIILSILGSFLWELVSLLPFFDFLH